MIEVNGKSYPLWSKFIEGKEKFIGGKLQDNGDAMDRRIGFSGAETEITDIQLRPNGTESAFFKIIGREFSCGFDVQYGGISGHNPLPGWITFSGYMSQTFRIKGKEST